MVACALLGWVFFPGLWAFEGRGKKVSQDYLGVGVWE